MKRLIIIVISIASLLFVSCKSIPEKKGKLTINGMIYDTENRPAVNYEIYLNGKYQAVTDIGGRFTLKDIKPGLYEFEGKGNGYLGVTDQLDIYDRSQIIYLRIPTVESKYKEAYEFLQELKIDSAKRSIEEVLTCYANDATALFFMSVIEYMNNNKENCQYYLDLINLNGDGSLYVEEMHNINNIQ